MKLILENWNNFLGKQPLNERQIRNLRTKYPVLDSNGIINTLLESEHNFHVPSVTEDAQTFFDDSRELFKESFVLDVIKNRINNEDTTTLYIY
mgnify:CR=1 FL=1